MDNRCCVSKIYSMMLSLSIKCEIVTLQDVAAKYTAFLREKFAAVKQV